MTAASDSAQPSGESLGGDSGSTLRDVPQKIAEQARGTLKSATDRVADEARDFAEKGKEGGAERIDGVAQAIHSAADQLGRDLPQAAGYIHEAAARLEHASSMVRERSVEDLMSMVDDFARRQPAAFFGGSVLAGFVLSRFLKSSNARRRSGGTGSDYGPGSDFGGTH